MKLTLDEVAMPLHDDVRLIRRTNRGGRIIGSLRYICYEDAWLLDNIFVHQSFRGKGHASSMLDELLHRSEEEDSIPVVLRVVAGEFSSMDNEQLYSWYQRHGFKDHGSWAKYGKVMVSY